MTLVKLELVNGTTIRVVPKKDSLVGDVAEIIDGSKMYRVEYHGSSKNVFINRHAVILEEWRG